jgi:hypothetical protein
MVTGIKYLPFCYCTLIQPVIFYTRQIPSNFHIVTIKKHNRLYYFLSFNITYLTQGLSFLCFFCLFFYLKVVKSIFFMVQQVYYKWFNTVLVSFVVLKFLIYGIINKEVLKTTNQRYLNKIIQMIIPLLPVSETYGRICCFEFILR